MSRWYMPIFFPLLCCLLFQHSAFAQVDTTRGLKPGEKSKTTWGNTYALVVGISNYRNITQLSYADDDAEAFRDFLVSTKIVKDAADVQILIDSVATSNQIYSELRKISAKVKPGNNDRVFIYFAGHGDNDTETEQGYLLAYDCNDAVAYYDTDAIFIPLLESIINGLSKKAKVLLITDACRSGNLAGNLSGALRTMKALNDGFSNTIKILSCKPGQLSQEKHFPGGGHGVFTKYLLESLYGLGVDEGTSYVTISDVDDYITKKVSDETNKDQRPVLIYDADEVIAKVDAEMRTAMLAKTGKGQGNVTRRDVKTQGYNLSPDDSLYFKKFYEQLRTGRLNYPKGNNAYETYKNAKGVVKNEELINSMKYDLAAKLEDAVQPLLNRFIRAEFQDYPDSLFNDANNKLKIVQDELMDSSDFRYNEIKAKRIFFIASIYKTSRALELFRVADSLMPNSTFISFEIGRYFSEVEKNTDSALVYLQKAIRLSPRWSYPRFMIGNVYYRNKEYNRAISFYTKAIELQPKFAYALFNQALAYKQLRQKDSADYYYKKALLLDKSFENEWGTERKTEDEIVSLGKTVRATEVNEDLIFAGLLPPKLNKPAASDSYEAREGYEYYTKAYYWNIEGKKDSAREAFIQATALFDKAYANKSLPDAYYYAWAYAWQMLDDNNKALDIYKQGLAKDSLDADLYYFGIAWIEDRNNNHKEALEWYKKAVAFNPSYYQASNNIGWLYARNEQPDSAIHYYRKALGTKPDFTISLHNLATAYFDQMKDDSAIYYYKKLLPLLSPPDAYVLNRIGISYEYLDKYDSAVHYYSKAISIEPEEPVFYRNKGNAYYKGQEYEKAIEQYEKGNTLMPDSSKTYFNLALSHSYTGDYVKSEEIFRESLKKQKPILNIYLTYYNLGWVLDKQKKFTEAIHWYSKAVKEKPTYTSGLNNLGYIYDRLGNYDSAVYWYKKAHQADPVYTTALTNLAIIYTDLYNYDSALHYYKILMPLKPKDAVIPYEIASSYYYKRAYDSAYIYIVKAVNLNPGSASYRVMAGDILFDAAGYYRETALYENAIQSYKDALYLDSTQYLAMNRLGVSYIYLEKFKEGIEIFELALKKDVVYKNTYEYNLACIYSLLNETEKALDYFDRSIQSGYKDLEHMTEDTDLDNIRYLPVFKAIIEKYFTEDEIKKYPELYRKK